MQPFLIEPDKINKEFLLLIKTDSAKEKLFIDKVPLEKPFYDSFKKIISDFKNKKLGLEKIIENIESDITLKPLVNYSSRDCVNLSGTEEGFNQLTKKLQAIKSSLEKVQDSTSKRKKLRSNFEKDLERRYVALCKSETYKLCKVDKKTHSYSYTLSGFRGKSPKIIGDFQYTIETNFGYGMSSYFFTKLKYKEVPIILFADWITFSIANLATIIDYSSRHNLENDSWLEAMNFVVEAQNCLESNEEEFIQKYIIEQCDLLINGLYWIMKADYKTLDERYKFFDLNKTYFDIAFEGHNLVEFKGRKITGALKFIEALDAYVDYLKVNEIITDIEALNSLLLTDLKKEIEIIDKRLKNVETKIEQLEIELGVLKIENDKFILLEKEFRQSAMASMEKLDFFEIKKKFNDLHPKAQEITSKYSQLEKEYKKTTLVNSKLIIILKKLNLYLEEINGHFIINSND